MNKVPGLHPGHHRTGGIRRGLRLPGTKAEGIHPRLLLINHRIPPGCVHSAVPRTRTVVIKYAVSVQYRIIRIFLPDDQILRGIEAVYLPSAHRLDCPQQHEKPARLLRHAAGQRQSVLIPVPRTAEPINGRISPISGKIPGGDMSNVPLGQIKNMEVSLPIKQRGIPHLFWHRWSVKHPDALRYYQSI